MIRCKAKRCLFSDGNVRKNLMSDMPSCQTRTSESLSEVIFGSFSGCFSKLLRLLCSNVAPKLCEMSRPDNRARSGQGVRQPGGPWGVALTSKTLTSLCVHNGSLCARVLQVKAKAKYSIVIWCRLWPQGKTRRLFHHKHTHQFNGQLKQNFCRSRSAPSAGPYLGFPSKANNPPDTREAGALIWIRLTVGICV